MVVIRHGASGAAQFLAERIESNVINAGDGTHEHPTQGLLDLLTLRDHFEHARRAARSASSATCCTRASRARTSGGSRRWAREVGVCGPRSLLPNAIDELGVTVFNRVEEAIEWADALNILRLQLERMQAGYIPSLREYNRVFGVSRERLDRAPRDILILHPGPMNRGVEIDSDVADGPHSVILDQVTNGVAVRMAVLYLLVGRQAGAGRSGEGRRRRRDDERDRAPARGGRVDRSVADARRRSRDVLIVDGKIEAVGRARRDDAAIAMAGDDRLHGLRRVAGLHRRALPSARAGPRRSRDDRDRRARRGGGRIHRGVRDAEHRSGHRQSGGGRLHHSPGADRATRRASIRSARSRVGQKGESLAEFGEMVGAGAVAVSDDGKPVVSAHLMRTALEYARTFGIPVADHCEEPTLAARRRDERRHRERAARPQGHSRGSRRDHGDPRHPARAAHRRPHPSLPHEHARDRSS